MENCLVYACLWAREVWRVSVAAVRSLAHGVANPWWGEAHREVTCYLRADHRKWGVVYIGCACGRRFYLREGAEADVQSMLDSLDTPHTGYVGKREDA